MQHLLLLQTRVVEADVWKEGWSGIQDSPGADNNIVPRGVDSSDSRCRSYNSHDPWGSGQLLPIQQVVTGSS